MSKSNEKLIFLEQIFCALNKIFSGNAAISTWKINFNNTLKLVCWWSEKIVPSFAK